MIPIVKPYIAPKEKMMPAIEEILYSGYIAEGQAVYQFEDQLKEFLNVPNLIATNSGTAALHIALLLLGVTEGDEVISTAFTAEPTNTTIALTGAKIVWGDVEQATGLLDPISVEKKITSKTKAIVVVHYAGMVCDMDRFNTISEKYGIPIIEDAAHALGSCYLNKKIGYNSAFTCFSFQAIKHMTTVDGGALAIRDQNLVNEAKRLRWFGLDKGVSRLKNNINRAGYKYAMNNVTATIGSVQLTEMDKVLTKHLDNGKYLDDKLSKINGVKTIPYHQNTTPSYWLYTLHVEKKSDFIKMMEANGITATELHLRNDAHTLFAESKCALPGLDAFYKTYIHIPCGWWVSEEDREYIIDIIRGGW
ncbi:aminotransferase class V-fold PLP-dependent enzyme [Ihubacter massiliensis]|uniref:Aminotransferase class V-fold PLP-dependent enzyme n=1 Tax=Hominibacterium faecale TaxID=2839743 RepID=A0A9J6QY77_9FIRM|nr:MULTISPECIES: aminotransferase class V-fold PLP-dependent enzyme [Eubacteriales Family XIII. Incertae Sedis]MCO7123753.1 aminotransferase class V-fold PLP-dependent enzyme [Ihubacter massiliensis]MCU7380408.1 aminotransferase class V-fold PLP-dependent enzyme [Hominibacterium faecale]